ncbi:type I methionyl aminopeptidase [Deinococcus yavapaiensis]|uniref:Methionine aminopeptidase n=1 Tax=Deinococcus yavapaiensis KR-236 TaxID=694435 RepID=A0A318SAI0_9DEIO|nr:type I methionyl aminopeptidase [Deinococcus yavapaiensis]PYE53538.1 methionine aminopeptidase type I [Deinococcus yavapaiensis KR-236]
MTIQDERDLDGMTRAGHVVADTLRILEEAVAPGVTPADLDALAGEVFRRHGASSAPRAVYGAPVNVFVSVNDDVVHGLPSKRPLKEGDVVSLDVTPLVDGFVADAALTVAVPPVSPVAQRLVACAEAAFEAAMQAARAGRPLNVIGRAVEAEVARRGFSLLRELQGHGVGRTIHEAPDVPNFYQPSLSKPLREGLVLAIEPMVSSGRSWRTRTRTDGWTICTRDGGLAAHYEHTVVITKRRPLILTA